MKLNPAQEMAALHKDGPMLVLAGPGSGKTLVIAQRIKNLITIHKIDPASILVITFTKAAALEMKERFARLMEGDHAIGKEAAYQSGHNPITFGTFHAIFFQILKHAYGFHGGNIIRDAQRFELMRQIIAELKLEYDDENDLVLSLLNEISRIKNTAIPVEHYESANCSQEVFAELYHRYQEQLVQKRLLDFDDMLVYCHELFTQREDILSAWQKKYRYILIDEFQDVNLIQFEVVKLLAGAENNIFAVGDDDQAIYQFRGARPEIMLGFEKTYRKARRILLDYNYRSRASIMLRSQSLISFNSNRFSKQIKAVRNQGDDIRFQLFENQVLENKAIIKAIQEYQSKGGFLQDMAVLFRTNTQPRLLMEQLLLSNIPFRTKDKIPNLYDHWIARDIFTYIKIAMGSRDRKDFLRIMNRPNRYIKRESVEEPKLAFDAWSQYYEDSSQPWIAERILQLEADLRVIGRIVPFAALNYIRNGIGYEGYLKEYSKERGIKEEELMAVLDELTDAAKEFRSFAEWLLHIEEYQQELRRQKEEWNSYSDCITLATLHSAKGLEYDFVAILGCNEGIMPYKKALLPAELEEERRMFYVGMTRAKNKLYLSAAQKINGKNAEVSRFIREAFVYKENESDE